MIQRIRVRPIALPTSPRLAREAEVWKRSNRRPNDVVLAGPDQESVWDYPRPPAVQQVLDRVTVEFGGEVIANTTAALRMCETASPPTYYVPRSGVRLDLLAAATGTSMCEWKGAARYHSVVVGSKRAERCAWSYPSPSPEYEALAGHYGFYAGRMDRCTVGGVVVKPQPGEFYAGWITPDLVGPFKGAPGSQGW